VGEFTQIDDLNPGIAQNGLFWTMALPQPVDVNLGKGNAVMRGTDLHVLDFGDFTNSIGFGGVPPVPATVSFTVQWSGVDDRAHVVNTDDGHAGEFVRNGAQMEWSAVVGDYEFVSAPLSTSTSDFAEIGQERNGVFFPNG
jgi:hypothetical protein